MKICTIECDDANHRIGMKNNGELVLLDHDLDEEETLHAMGFEVSFCFECLRILRDNPTYMLWQAAYCKNTGIFEMAIAAGADVRLNEDDILKHLALNGRTEYVKHLLRAGCNVHAGEDEPLRLASGAGYTEIVELLLEAGADTSAKDYEALRYAAAKGHRQITEALLACEVEQSGLDAALDAAYANGRADVVKLLVRAGAKSKWVNPET